MRYWTLLLLTALLLPGCGTTKYLSGERAAAVQNNPGYLWNLKMGRDYSAQARYELAKEHYLMALAAADTPDARSVAGRELQAVDTMIKTQR